LQDITRQSVTEVAKPVIWKLFEESFLEEDFVSYFEAVKRKIIWVALVEKMQLICNKELNILALNSLSAFPTTCVDIPILRNWYFRIGFLQDLTVHFELPVNIPTFIPTCFKAFLNTQYMFWQIDSNGATCIIFLFS
jgi:hypothetical protein